MYAAYVFFPLLNLPELDCKVSLINASPNDWELEASDAFVHVAQVKDGAWSVRCLTQLPVGHHFVVSSEEHFSSRAEDSVAVVFLAPEELAGNYRNLPNPGLRTTSLPQWRASICLNRKGARACYQGEIEPFASRGTALSFHPFIQPRPFVNFFLGINIEVAAEHRPAQVHISRANDRALIATHSVVSNSAFLLALDNYGFSQQDLPVIWSADLSMIPSGLGWDPRSGQMSWEHTHPPASMTVFGRRWEHQALVKKEWFAALADER